MEITGGIRDIQFNSKLVWFTGGMDSTYSLQHLLNKNYESVGVGYISHGGFGIPRYVDEIITRRVILNQLKEKKLLGGLNEQEIYVTSDSTLASCSIVRQAVTIANASVQTLLVLSLRKPICLPDIVIGWHKDDVRERSLSVGDFSSSQYNDLVNYIKIGLNTFNDKSYFDIDVILPAWDVDKGDMCRAVADYPITFGNRNWFMDKGPNGEVYVTLTNQDSDDMKPKEMEYHYGVVTQPIKFNVKDFTVGDLLFLTKTNPDFIEALVQQLFPVSDIKTGRALLRDALSLKAIASFDDFFIADNKPWTEVLDLKELEAKVVEMTKDHSEASTDEQPTNKVFCDKQNKYIDPPELTPFDLDEPDTPKGLTETQLKQMKENSSLIDTPDVWEEAGLKSAMKELTSVKEHVHGEIKCISDTVLTTESETSKEIEAKNLEEIQPVEYNGKKES